MQRSFILVIVAFLMGFTAQAQVATGNSDEPEETVTLGRTRDEIGSDEKASDKFGNAVEGVKSAVGRSREERAGDRFVITANYLPFDMHIPSKIGATAGWIRSSEKTVELEYVTGSIAVPFVIKDLGSMTDTRISLIQRSYGSRQSFNFYYGLAYLKFDIHVGSAILSRINAAAPSIDLIGIESLAGIIGLGNRWTIANGFTIGVDWLSWTQPLLQTKKEQQITRYMTSQSDRDTVERAMDVVSYFPRFTLAKIQLGYSF